MSGKKTIVYIAGPMTGYPKFNFPAFFEVEERLKNLGFDVINPARMDVELDNFHGEGEPPLTTEQYEARDLPLVEKADRILMLSGWRNSKGACKERRHFIDTHEHPLIGDTILGVIGWHEFDKGHGGPANDRKD
ncbi:MAG: DUF4406 domain-containing protein [Planctomycetes bacterium]|nr:DUF4406 domain-containing protein [Planctomycetota bacterium]